MNHRQPRTPWKTSLVVCFALLPLAWLASYFALLTLPSSLHLPASPSTSQSQIEVSFIQINGEWNRYPNYRGVPRWFFAPIHHYDRTWLRPHLWSGTSPRNQELSLDWLAPK
jgi:hypothetical protein